jgi:nucleoporin SEH1
VQAHLGSVWKVVWAHPEFGQVIASCSYDRNVYIWEEEEMQAGKRKWAKRGQLVDARDNVVALAFAPKTSGLRLATGSLDGYVRIYEAADVMDLEHWSLVEDFEAARGGVLALAWNPALFGPPQLAVAAAAPADPAHLLRLWEYSESHRRWQPLESLLGHQAPVTDLAWAPNTGRSYHLLASASRDHTVRIWCIQPPAAASATTAAGAQVGQRPEVQQVACFTEHQAEVWRVQWNLTGTVLASSGDDGRVRLWRASFQGPWRQLAVIAPDDALSTASTVASASETTSGVLSGH